MHAISGSARRGDVRLKRYTGKKKEIVDNEGYP